MIRISCTNCKTVLSIDDAFAGGVCRCQHCGTIQTVPAAARDTAAVGAAGAGGSKSLFQQGGEGRGTGLDELANVVASSGLSSTRLKRPEDNSAPRNNPILMPLLIGGGIMMAILIVIIIFLLTRNSSPASAPGPGGDNSGATSSVAVPANVANFCGTRLDGNTIIYLIDSGGATQQFLGELKDATIKSATSLGSDRKFQILFWNNSTDGAYPEDTTAYATKESVDAAEKAIADVYAYGQSDIKTSLQKAISEHPDEIVIATGKGWDLDNAWLDGAMAIRGNSPAKIITYNIISEGDSESAPLRRLAEQTGGSYHEATKSQLHSAGQ